MADVITRKTRKGKRFYGRGYIEVDESGSLRRTCKLLLTDGEGHAIESITQARAEVERLEGAAEQRAYRIRNGLPDPKPVVPTPKPLTVGDLCERFLAEYSRPRIKDIAKYRRDARSVWKCHVKDQLGHRLATDVTRKDVERLREGILARKKSKQTVVHAMKLVSLLYKWGTQQDLVACLNPTAGVERPMVPLGKPDYYTQEEIENIFAAAGEFSPYVAPAMALMVYGGLRLGEACGLTWQDVDTATEQITIARSWRTTPKNGEVKTIPIPPELARILREWRKDCPPSQEGLVVAVPKQRGQGARMANPHDMQIIKELLSKAGCHIPKRYNHTGRHSFATALAAAGTHPIELKELGRWKTMSQVERYAHAQPSRLRAQVARLNFAPKAPAGTASFSEAQQKRAQLDTKADTESHAADESDSLTLPNRERLGRV